MLFRADVEATDKWKARDESLLDSSASALNPLLSSLPMHHLHPNWRIRYIESRKKPAEENPFPALLAGSAAGLVRGVAAK